MSVTVYDWPALLKRATIAFDQRGMTIGGPATLSGLTQVLSYDAGYWVASLDVATIGQGDQVRVYRALRALLEGGAQAVRVPVTDDGQVPWALAGGAAANEVAGVPFDDNATYDDLTGHYQPAIDAVLSAAAALRATAIAVTVRAGGSIDAGSYFSIGDRLHLIKQVLSGYGTTSLSLAIWPPLRAAAESGAALNFDRPVCRMRLTGKSAMDLKLGRLWQASPAASFIEEFRD